MPEDKENGGWNLWGEGVESRFKDVFDRLMALELRWAYAKGILKVVGIIVGVIVIPLVLLYLKQKLFKAG